MMANEVRIESRPWKPQDLIDDIQLMIDEEPDNYLNSNRTTLCMAKDYLEKFFAEESMRPKGKWKLNKDGSGTCSVCHRTRNDVWDMDNWDNYCSHCGADMREG